MTRCFAALIFSLVLVTVLRCDDVNSFAQNAANSDGPQTGLLAIKLSAPIYPPVAREALITSDVDLTLDVR
jgi:hypothetical protein